jgi:hypothetical protein
MMIADDEILDGVRASRLATLPDDVLDRVLAGATSIEVPAGSVAYRKGNDPFIRLVVRGLATDAASSSATVEPCAKFQHRRS